MRPLPLALALSVVLLSACGERGADADTAADPVPAPDAPSATAPTPETEPAAGHAGEAEPCPDTAPAADDDVEADAPAAVVAAEDARVLRFDARQPIDACVWLNSRDDGGRRTPAFSSYRPQVVFAAVPDEEAQTPAEPVPTTCSLQFATSPLEPGAGTQAELACVDAVVVDERAHAFEIIEGGRLVGGGRVRFPQPH